jgi:hypothetical protein
MSSLPLMFSPMSAGLLADRMRFLVIPEILADVYEINPPAGFDAERWADVARDLTRDLREGKAIQTDPASIALLVESLEGNSVIGAAPASKRAGLIQMATMIAKRLEPYAGRPVHPEVY